MNNSNYSNSTPQDNLVHNIAKFTHIPQGIDISQPTTQYPPVPRETPKKDVNVPKEEPKQDVLLSADQMNMYVEQCKPQAMANPVKITEPSYLITEQQMIYLLSLAQGNPQSNVMPQTQRTKQKVQHQPQQIVIGNPQTQRTSNGNVVDIFCNATLGTAGRIAHAFTGIVDSVVDVVTLGYGTKR